MTLFRWHSSYLRNYGSGQIIVMAPDVATARQLAEAEFPAYDRERYGWMYAEGEPYDDPEDIAARLATFRQDLAAEPEIMGNVVLVRGSE